MADTVFFFGSESRRGNKQQQKVQASHGGCHLILRWLLRPFGFLSFHSDLLLYNIQGCNGYEHPGMDYIARKKSCVYTFPDPDRLETRPHRSPFPGWLVPSSIQSRQTRTRMSHLFDPPPAVLPKLAPRTDSKSDDRFQL